MALTQEQQKQLALVGLVVLVAPWVWWQYLMTPIRDKIKVIRDENAAIADKVDTMKRTANRLASLQQERDALLTEVSKAEKKLPREQNRPEILRILTEQAQRQKIFIGSISPEAERPLDYRVEIPFAISYTANINSIGRFLAAMGQQERIFSARNLTLSFSMNQKRGHTVTGSFSLVAYIFKG